MMLGKRQRDGSPDLSVSKRPLESEAPVVCAIDFGTTFSGYAYAYTKLPDEIKKNDPCKTRTSLLLDQQANFLSFGLNARRDYANQDDKGMLFEEFKMRLDDHHNGLEPVAEASNGNRVPLLKVITHSLKQIKDEAMNEINNSQVMKLSPSEIKWVVTVPAIWREVAKGMMRRAAFDAGMIQEESSGNLVLCLEPEAACMACKEQRLAGAGAAGMNVLKIGDTFMVVDCGGGTVDITVHSVEQMSPLQISEVREPSGGPWGSTYIDAEFKRFLRRLIGEASWERLKPLPACVDMMEAWEKTKIEFKPSEQHSARIRMSEVVAAAEVLGGTSLQTCVDTFNTQNGSNLELRHGTAILMPKAQMCSFFSPIVNKIVSHVRDLLDECKKSANPVKYIYLVGGFGESEILQSRVRVEFEGHYGLHVIVPMRPQAMVVTGAVLFGLQKGSTIQSRVARYTYGFGHSLEYDDKNPEHKQRFQQTSLKNTSNGKIRYVHGIFKALVKQGSKICVSEKHIKEGYTHDYIDHTSVAFNLYSSSSPTCGWVDVDGMTKIGKVTIDCLRGQSLSISMSFGNTEIMATATNKTTGQVSNATIKWDFNSL